MESYSHFKGSKEGAENYSFLNLTPVSGSGKIQTQV